MYKGKTRRAVRLVKDFIFHLRIKFHGSEIWTSLQSLVKPKTIGKKSLNAFRPVASLLLRRILSWGCSIPMCHWALLAQVMPHSTANHTQLPCASCLGLLPPLPFTLPSSGHAELPSWRAVSGKDLNFCLWQKHSCNDSLLASPHCSAFIYQLLSQGLLGDPRPAPISEQLPCHVPALSAFPVPLAHGHAPFLLGTCCGRGEKWLRWKVPAKSLLTFWEYITVSVCA